MLLSNKPQTNSSGIIPDFSLLITASYITILANGSMNPLVFTLSVLRSKNKSKRDRELENLTRAHLADKTCLSKEPLRSRSSRSARNVSFSHFLKKFVLIFSFDIDLSCLEFLDQQNT